MMKKNNQARGFTLIELMIVIAIIGILASIAIPPYQIWTQSARVTAAMRFAEQLQGNISQYYRKTASFPNNNASAGLPAPEKLISPKVAGVTVADGALHLLFRGADTLPKTLAGKQLTLRPVYVKGSPKTPISWICGNAIVPKGMTAAGENRTNIPVEYLPVACRNLAGKINPVPDTGKLTTNTAIGGKDNE